jgi:hypothetical protein
MAASGVWIGAIVFVVAVTLLNSKRCRTWSSIVRWTGSSADPPTRPGKRQLSITLGQESI